MIFEYPQTPHERRHAPAGYTDYQTYKDWIRDEFTFRCVYCLNRERFSSSDESDAFGVDHVLNKRDFPELACVYENLVYSCNRCNGLKNTTKVLNPCETGFAQHLKVHADGTIQPLTVEGERLVLKLKLDSPKRNAFRRYVISLHASYRDRLSDATALHHFQHYFGYPHPLPDLSTLRPPQNHKPDSIQQSHFARHQCRELAATY